MEIIKQHQGDWCSVRLSTKEWQAIGDKAGWTYGTEHAQAAGADGIRSNSVPEITEVEVDQCLDETSNVHVEVLFNGDGQS